MLTKNERMVLLQSASIFDGLPERTLHTIAGYAQERVFEKGVVIVKEGEKGDQLFIIASGKTVISKKTTRGHDSVVTALGPVECFGEMALVDEQPRSASVKALDRVVVLTIDRENFREMISSHPDVAINMIKLLARRLRAITRLYTMT